MKASFSFYFNNNINIINNKTTSIAEAKGQGAVQEFKKLTAVVRLFDKISFKLGLKYLQRWHLSRLL